MVRLMNRWTRTQFPTLPRLLIPVVDHNVHNKLLTNKERQAVNYNKGAKDLAELKSGDTVRLIPPRRPAGESVKARVDNSVGTRRTKWLLKMMTDIDGTVVICGKLESLTTEAR